ncbi:MAG: hypothetical protein ABI443_09710 [Chthoniobacterales bacterium]
MTNEDLHRESADCIVFRELAKRRDWQFYGLTACYLLSGIFCFLLDNNSREMEVAFLQHAALVIGFSVLYLILVAILFRFYTDALKPFTQRFPSSVNDLIEKYPQEKTLKTIKQSTGYARYIGLKVSLYHEVQGLRDFGRVLSALALVVVLNLGWNDHSDLTIPILVTAVALFLWISGRRYQNALRFLQSLV